MSYATGQKILKEKILVLSKELIKIENKRKKLSKEVTLSYRLFFC